MGAVEATVVERSHVRANKCRHRLVLRCKSRPSWCLILEANTKSNEIGGFDCKCCRCLIISRALGPDNGRPSFTIPSHEYIRLILGNVYLFSVNSFPEMNDNPLRIVFRNSVYGLLDGRKISIAIDIDLDCPIGADFLCQQRRVYNCLCRQAINMA